MTVLRSILGECHSDNTLLTFTTFTFLSLHNEAFMSIFSWLCLVAGADLLGEKSIVASRTKCHKINIHDIFMALLLRLILEFGLTQAGRM